MPIPSTQRFIRIVILTLFLASTQAASEEKGRFLLISDIHFSPFGTAELSRELASKPASEWESILATAADTGRVSNYGYDSNYELMRSALADASRNLPAPDFILYPGDFMAHEWYKQYLACFGSAEGYQAFTRKAIAFMGLQFRKFFGATPVLPTLGNDDAFCGDYLIQPKGDFLRMFARLWQRFLGKGADLSSFREHVPIGGYYSIKLPQMKAHRLVVLNSIFMSAGYPKGPCDNGLRPVPPSLCRTAGSPGACELQWLEEVLTEARQAGERVWLLMHIPPGLNSYTTAKDGSPASFWDAKATETFSVLLASYGDLVQVAFAGHTHMDDYRLLDYGKGRLLTKIAPAVSPIFGNNPAYQIYHYDRSSGALSTFVTHYLDLAAPAATIDTIPTCYFPAAAYSSAATWRVEYDFARAYQASALDAPSIYALMQQMAQSDSSPARLYSRYYGVSVSGISQSVSVAADVYRCCVLSHTPAEYSSCDR